jgi:ABC-type molybdate transport system substrate-binding protein
VVAVLSAVPARAQHPLRSVKVHAAGSLRAAFEDLARAFQKVHAIKVKPTFGASGLLKDRIVAGESPQVFASANMEHPEALVAAGRAASVSAFAGNALCVLATPSFSLQGKSLALRLLDADVRLGTSTPGADPSGDYAFTMFERIESSGAAGPGLGGGAEGQGPAADRRARLARTARGPQRLRRARRRRPGRRLRHLLHQRDRGAPRASGAAVLTVPETINVSARYGLALLEPASADAQTYAQFLLGRNGQAILAVHGFAPP